MRRVLKSLAIGIATLVIYEVVSGSLLMYYAGGDVNRIRSSPPFDIATRLPTVILKYFFPEQVSNFYRPGITNEKIFFAIVSLLMNVIIFSAPAYLLLWVRDRTKKVKLVSEGALPPPPPSFDS
jgi:hypothetical protein